MRQLATLDNRQQAHRLASYLITQGISSVAEEDPPGWSVWVREEDQLAEALRELKVFEENPNDPKYLVAEQEAEAMRREARQRQQQQQRNMIEMRDRWSRNTMSGPRPLTITIIVLCALIGFLTEFGSGALQPPLNRVMAALLFMNPEHVIELEKEAQLGRISPDEFISKVDSLAFRTTDLRQGQLWRIVTPAFLHGSVMHLVMNMWTLWVIGSPIERRYGTAWYGILILILAIPSTVSGSIAPLAWDGSPFGLGFSGVLFGFIGYMWVRAQHEPASGFYMPPSTLIFVGIFLVFGLTRLDEQFFGAKFDNWAHGVGLVSGVLVGYAQQFLRLKSK